MSPEAQLAGFISRFTPEIAALAESAVVKMRERLPNSVAQALQAAKVPLSPSATGRLVIKSVSAKQRPRRPGRVRER